MRVPWSTRNAHCRRSSAAVILSVVALFAACGDDDPPSPAVVISPATSTTIASGGVRVGFVLTAQTELVSPQGVHVLIDIADPSKVLEPVTDQDILLTTHDHPDHTVNAWSCAADARYTMRCTVRPGGPASGRQGEPPAASLSRCRAPTDSATGTRRLALPSPCAGMFP